MRNHLGRKKSVFPQWWNACLKGWDWGGYCYTTAWQSGEMWGSTVLTHSLRFQTSSWLEEIPRFSSPQKWVKTSGIPIILGTKDRPGCYTTSRTLLTSSFTCNKPHWRTTQCPTQDPRRRESISQVWSLFLIRLNYQQQEKWQQCWTAG